jgi:citrate lyase beta subunit
MTSLSDELVSAVARRVSQENARLRAHWTGDRIGRQPVHSFYGGAHLYQSGSAKKLGAAALRALDEYAPDSATLARVVGLEDAALASAVHLRVREKLVREPIEDQRIDFEDGYGHRSDLEEDAHAAFVGRELARGAKEGSLPPFIGVRVKPFSDELVRRSLRTLDLVVSTLVTELGSRIPRLIVTLPKVTTPAHVTGLSDAIDALEAKLGIERGTLCIELMIETTSAFFDLEGRLALVDLAKAARGRCSGVHFGTYDYTAQCNISAAHQRMDHPACDFAKHLMQIAFSGTGVFLSDGATNVMPVAIHRGSSLTLEEQSENREAVHRAWRRHYDDARRSLVNGFYQGWDLHPAQLVTRYAAVYAFFLESLPEASSRLASFIEKAARASLAGNVFDDAATGQGLLAFFLRGLASGALTGAEVLKTGLSVEELKGRSFLEIVNARRA